MQSINYLTPFDICSASNAIMGNLADWDLFNCKWQLKEKLPRTVSVRLKKGEDFLEMCDQIEIMSLQNGFDYDECLHIRGIFKVLGIRRKPC